ncbi:MAG: TonB-dependent receptor [Parasphingorhabdus sp.]|uniref:TonB-dependent receptor n=2 Tax=Parasphingorhabdus sp. TaxID=2709688 RepID=UPI00326442A5
MKHQLNGSSNKSASFRRAALQLGAAATTIALMGNAAQAQEAGAQEDQSGLNVIVVTAQKRAQGLQDTPIAITAVSGETLEAQGAENISNLQQITPNLIFDTTAPVSGVSSGAIVFIRGVGQTDFQLTTDPGVGTYVDGIYISRSVGGVLDVLDLERVEVLRGPQGTLFGRNTIGGAISLVSKRPSDSFAVKAEATVTSRDGYAGLLALDVPLSDSIRTKFVGSYKTQDGYVTGLSDGRQLGDTDRFSIRGTIEADLGPNLLATVSADYTRVDEQNAASKLVGISVAAPGSPTRTDFRFDRATGGVITTNTAVPPGAPTLTFLQNVGPTGVFDQRFILPGLDTTVATGPNGTELDIWGVGLTLALDVGFGELKSITAYRKTTGSFARDADGSPIALTHTNNFDYSQDQFSQELQLTGSTADDRLKFALGAYYFDENGTDNLTVTLPFLFGNVNNFAEVNNKSYAAYAQGTFSVTDRLSVTAGARYTEDEKSYTVPVDGGAIFNGPAAVFGPAGTFTPFFPAGTVSQKFDNVSFKGVIDYKLDDGTLFYVSYSEGFKSGGFNTRYLVPVPSVQSFAPEELTTYEAGIKWEGLDRRLRLNGAVYSSDYDNIQLVVYDSGAPLTRNAGSADIWGFELEATALPIDELELGLSAGYIDAEYQTVTPLNPLVAGDNQVQLDSALPNTPEWSLSAYAALTLPVTDDAEIRTRADWSYTSRIENDSVNSIFLTQPGVHLINASIGLHDNNSGFSTTAFVKNLTNKRYIVSGDSNFGIGFHEANFNEPREWGVTLRYKY